MLRALLLALVLAISLPMAAGGVVTDGRAAEPVAPSLEDGAILTLEGPERSGFATASTDVASAIAIQHEAGSAHLDRYAIDERVETAGSLADRRTVLSAAIDTIEENLSTLESDERAVRAAYANREIDSRTFLRRFALINVRAGGIETRLDRVKSHANALPPSDLNEEVQLLDPRLIGYSGTVRQHAVAVFTGQASPTRFAVSASVDGSVLAMLDDGRYLREAYRADQRTLETDGDFNLDDAASRAFILYPVAYSESRQPGYGQNIDGSIGGNLYLVRISFPSGIINAYLDDGTRNVFFEIQERRLDLLGERPSVVGAANGTWIAVNRSYPGGPLQVTLADNETREPIQGSVLIDDVRLQTDSEGVVWTLAPVAPSFDVTAVGPRGNVTVSVRPFTPTPLNTSA